jgi:hypothetical protein
MNTNAVSALLLSAIALALPVKRAQSQVKEGEHPSFAGERNDLASHSKLVTDQSKALIPKSRALNTPIKLKIEIVPLIPVERSKEVSFGWGKK